MLVIEVSKGCEHIYCPIQILVRGRGPTGIQIYRVVYPNNRMYCESI